MAKVACKTRKCFICNKRGDHKKSHFQIAHQLIVQHYNAKIVRDDRGIINDLVCTKHLKKDGITLKKLQSNNSSGLSQSKSSNVNENRKANSVNEITSGAIHIDNANVTQVAAEEYHALSQLDENNLSGASNGSQNQSTDLAKIAKRPSMSKNADKENSAKRMRRK